MRNATPHISPGSLLAWLAGVEPALLHHAYSDRMRFVSLGMSVVAAACLAGSASVAAYALVFGSWTGWFLFPVVSAGFAVGLRSLMAWVWQSQYFGRRLWLVAAGLLVAAWLLAWPLQYYLLQTTDISEGITLRSLRWAIRLVVALVFLIPAYGIASARHEQVVNPARSRQRSDHLSQLYSGGWRARHWRRLSRARPPRLRR